MSAPAMARGELSGHRRDVLRVLKARPGPMSIGAIAKVLDVQHEIVRFHLGTLVNAGDECKGIDRPLRTCSRTTDGQSSSVVMRLDDAGRERVRSRLQAEGRLRTREGRAATQ